MTPRYFPFCHPALFALLTLFAVVTTANATPPVRGEMADASLPRYVFPADRSQPVAFYVARGLPDPARPWTQENWKQAVRTLTDVARQDAAALPRWQSPRSAALFARLLAEVDRRDDPARARLSPFDRYYVLEQRDQTAVDLFEIYFRQGRKRLPATGEVAVTLDREVVEITAAKLALLPEALAALEAVDRRWEVVGARLIGSPATVVAVRRKEFTHFREGWERFAAGMGNSFVNQARFREPARLRLAAAWKAAVLAGAPHFSPVGRQRLVNSATPGMHAETSANVRRLLAAALAHPSLPAPEGR